GRPRGAAGGRALDRSSRRALHRPRTLVSREPEIATLRLTGHDLSIADVVAVARRDVAVGLDRAAERKVQQAAKVVGQMADADEPVYGVNTGFGDLATVRIPHDELRVLQRNLLRSHAVGVGLPLPEDVVRAIMLLRANTLAAARSTTPRCWRRRQTSSGPCPPRRSARPTAPGIRTCTPRGRIPGSRLSPRTSAR